MFVGQNILILSWTGRMKIRISCMNKNNSIGFWSCVTGLTNISRLVGFRQPGWRLRFIYGWQILFRLVVVHFQGSNKGAVNDSAMCIWTCLSASGTERVNTLKGNTLPVYFSLTSADYATLTRLLNQHFPSCRCTYRSSSTPIRLHLRLLCWLSMFQCYVETNEASGNKTSRYFYPKKFFLNSRPSSNLIQIH